jgi:3-phenylpropionate/trans-cinnamate dioxygenase ferredoxin reductase subunit
MSETQPAAVAIVGAGQAGFQVAASLREQGYAGRITVLGDEQYLPYQRPPLSKTYIKEDVGPEKTYFRPQRFFDEQSIEVRTGSRVTGIDRTTRIISLDDGSAVSWDRLVLATGVVNRVLPVPGAELDGVVGLRGIDDAEDLRRRVRASQRIVIVGGGVIGLEVAALARGLGIEAVVVELGDRLCGRIGSAPLSEHLLRFHRDLGVSVHLGASVAAIEGRDGRVTGARFSTGKLVETDLVLVSVGVSPATGLAQAAGLRVDDGIVVDANMRTSDPDILAVGDCTRFGHPMARAATVRLESVQNAIDQGRCAATTILGTPRDYDALPWFWSDQGSLKLQIAGLSIGHDSTVVRADEAKGALTVYCFADGELVCVECINRAADFVASRRILGQRKRIGVADLERTGYDLRALM